MAANKCNICGKTAYPLESVKALDTVFHKWCFKCAECGITLNLKNFKGVGGKVYCFTHTPVDRASTSADDYTVKSNTEAQKKNVEARSAQLATQKGTGDAITQVADFTTASPNGGTKEER